MTADPMPSDAEIDDVARLIGAAIWRPQPCMSGNIWDRLGPLRERDCKRAALEALLATRRSADARVAAAYERGVRDAAKQAIHVGDNNREDMEARRIQGRILSLLTPKEAARDER